MSTFAKKKMQIVGVKVVSETLQELSQVSKSQQYNNLPNSKLYKYIKTTFSHQNVAFYQVKHTKHTFFVFILSYAYILF